MSWLEELQNEIGSFKLASGLKVKVDKNATHPRDNVIKLIDDSIKYFEDNSYTIKGAKDKVKKPDHCYEISKGKATVWLSYSRQKLKLDDKNSVITDIDENKVISTLQILRKAVESGFFDAQLDTIKSLRSEAQKKSKAKTAGKK
jgi:hypothetical protein